MATKAPAFQFYASDWAHSVSAMTLEERGAFITLLAWSWENGPLPDEMKRLAIILGVPTRKAKRVCTEVLKRWTQEPEAGRWINGRLEAVRQEQAQYRAKQAANGRLGGRPPQSQPASQAKPTGSSDTAGAPKPASSPPISGLHLQDQEQDQEQRTRPASPHRVLVKLAHTVYDRVEAGEIPESDDKEELKDLAGRNGIENYNSTEIVKALESARPQRARRDG